MSRTPDWGMHSSSSSRRAEPSCGERRFREAPPGATKCGDSRWWAMTWLPSATSAAPWILTASPPVVTRSRLGHPEMMCSSRDSTDRVVRPCGSGRSVPMERRMHGQSRRTPPGTSMSWASSRTVLISIRAQVRSSWSRMGTGSQLAAVMMPSSPVSILQETSAGPTDSARCSAMTQARPSRCRLTGRQRTSAATSPGRLSRSTATIPAPLIRQLPEHPLLGRTDSSLLQTRQRAASSGSVRFAGRLSPRTNGSPH